MYNISDGFADLIRVLSSKTPLPSLSSFIQAFNDNGASLGYII